MRRSNRNFNTPPPPPPRKPRPFELWKIELFKFPSPGAKWCSNALPYCRILSVNAPPKEQWLSVPVVCKGWFSYNRPHRFDRRCHFKKESYDRDDYMRTVHKGSLMPAAIGATAIAWIACVLSERLVADRGDRERFYENYSDAGRRWKRSKLYYTWCIHITPNSIRPHNQRGRHNSRVY